MPNPANLEIKKITLQLQAPKLWKNWVNYHKRGVFNFIFIKITYRCTPGLTVELVGRGGSNGQLFKNNIEHVYNTLSFTIFMEMFTQLIILGVCRYQLLYIYTRYYVALFKQDTCQVQLKMYLLHSFFLLFCFLFFVSISDFF